MLPDFISPLVHDPLNRNTHANMDLHLIGDSIPPPAQIPLAPTSTGSIGVSPYVAREDHAHVLGNTPGGFVAVTGLTAQVTGITVSAVQTAYNTTFMAVAGRRYKITVYVQAISNNTAGAGMQVLVTKGGAGQVGWIAVSPTASALTTAFLSLIDVPGAGSVTYSFSVSNYGGGSVTFNTAGANYGASTVLVEDIGV